MTAVRRCDCTDHPQISQRCVCRSGADAVTYLRLIREALESGRSPQFARCWLHAPNARLDGRTPMALVMAGAGERALAEARRAAAL